MFGGKQVVPLIGGGAAGAAQSLGSATDIHIFTIPFRCRPLRVGFTITETVSGGVAPIIKFDKRPTAGSDVSRGDGDVGTLTLGATGAAGKAYYEITDYKDDGTGSWVGTLNEGDQVVVQVSTASGANGTGIPWLIVEPDPERPANNSAMVSG